MPWQEAFGDDEGEEADGEHGARHARKRKRRKVRRARGPRSGYEHTRPVKEGGRAEYMRNRRAFDRVWSEFKGLRDSEKVYTLNEMLTKASTGVRCALRQHLSMKIEWFLASKALLVTLKEKFWSPMASLELRLQKMLPMSFFHFARRVFSLRQRSDGRWVRRQLLRCPGHSREVRRHGIYRPLLAPGVLSHPGELMSCQEDVLADYDFKESDDGVSVWLSPIQMTRELLTSAVRHGQLFTRQVYQVQCLGGVQPPWWMTSM